MMDVDDIPEADIEGAINYLKYFDPERANRETAIAMLSDIKQVLRNAGQNNPDLLFELQKNLEKKKPE